MYKYFLKKVHRNMDYKDDYEGDYDPDISNMTFIQALWIVKSPDYIIIGISIFLPVVILGILGNILIMHVLYKNPRIRTPTNLLIGNMALADLLSLLIHPWVFLIYDIFQNYILGPFGCKVEGSIECSLLLTSVISMSAVTYDRLTAIVLPKETRLNKKSAKIVIALTWIVGIVVASPLSLYRTYKERYWLDFVEKFCTENTLVINIYWYVIITVLVWLPLTIQLICYISIFVKLHKYEKLLIAKLEHRQVGYKKKAAKMMFLVTVTFMICRLPFTAMIIYRHQLLKVNGLAKINNVTIINTAKGMYHILWFTSKYLIFVNAAVNPIIYGLTNEKYSWALKNLALMKFLLPRPKDQRFNIKPIIALPKTKDDTDTKNIFFIFKRKLKSGYDFNGITMDKTPIQTTKVIHVT